MSRIIIINTAKSNNKAKELSDLLPATVKRHDRFRTMRMLLGYTNKATAKAAKYRAKYAAWEMSQIATGKRVPVGALKKNLVEMGFWRD